MTQDRPSTAELVAAVREFLERDVMPATEGRVQFHTRVAVNVARHGRARKLDARAPTLDARASGHAAARCSATTASVRAARRRELRRTPASAPASLDDRDSDDVIARHYVRATVRASKLARRATPGTSG